MTVYAVSPLAQKAEVDKFCFRECGQIIIGGLEIAFAPFCPCHTNPCPHLEKELSFGIGNFDWGEEEVIIRKLKNSK